MAEALELVFAALRERILRSSSGMNVAQDTPGNVVLKAPWNEPGKTEPAWIGAVQLKTNYVSCHLMPLYALPALREHLAADLRACSATMAQATSQGNWSITSKPSA